MSWPSAWSSVWHTGNNKCFQNEWVSFPELFFCVSGPSVIPWCFWVYCFCYFPSFCFFSLYLILKNNIWWYITDAWCDLDFNRFWSWTPCGWEIFLWLLNSLNEKTALHESYSQFLLFFYAQVKYFTCETGRSNGFDWIWAINSVCEVSYIIVMPISLPRQGETNYTSCPTAVDCVSITVP